MNNKGWAGHVMGNVVRFEQRHARTSVSSKRKKSSAVTAPPVSETIFSAMSREGQPVPSHSAVTHPLDTPILRAKSRRLVPCKSRYSASFMDEAFSPAKILEQVKLLAPLDGQTRAVHRKFSMTKRTAKKAEPVVQTRFKQPTRATYIGAWRQFRGKKQREVAEFLGVSIATVSQIENGKADYTQGYLEGMAELFQCAPADLLMRNPTDPEAIWSLWDAAKPAQRKQILGIIEGLLRSSAA